MALLTIRQQVYLTLRQRILDGTYSPGTHLNIDALSKELGVSNSPLREAMLLLINDLYDLNLKCMEIGRDWII